MPSGSPELTGSFHLSPSAAAGWTLFAFQVLGVLLEPPLLALAHGSRAPALRTLGLAAMAGALMLAAAAPTYRVLLVALALYGPASGLGTQLSQATLLAGAPGRHEAVLARWELLSAVGDLLAPAVLAASAALGLGWRGALLAVGVVSAVQAAAVARAPAAADEPVDDDDEDGAPLRQALRAALGSPRLLAWSAAVALCTLLDEVLVSFGALWLAQQRGMNATQRAVVLACEVLGAIAGAALLERAARRFRPPALLLVSGLGSAAAYVLWLAASGPVACAALAAALGLFTAPHYPLLRARAFAAMPGRAHVVLAVGAAFTVVDLVAPILVGFVADRAGLLAAMLLLLAQPLGVVAAALVVIGGRRRGPPPAPRGGTPPRRRARTAS